MGDLMAEVELRGPIFDGRAERVMDAYALRAEQEIGDQGVNMVRTNLAGVLKHETGRYRARIQTSRSTHTRVHDNNCVYGPWLEGTGSRNRTTRFKGYATFRRTRGQLDGAAVRIAQSVIGPYLEAIR